MDEIVGDGRQRSEAVSRGSEDESEQKRLASHVTRRYVTANSLAERNSCGPQAIDSEEVGNYLLDKRFPIKRDKELTPPKQRVEIAIEPALLNRYAGRYEFPDSKATVTRQGNHLVLAGDGDLPDAFYPETNQDFFSGIQGFRCTSK